MELIPKLFASPLVDIGGALPSKHERVNLSNGDQGTAETISIMQKLASMGKRNDDVRKVCGDVLTGKIPGIQKQNPKDYKGYAKALYTFCRDKILYAYDPHLVEYVESADRVLKNGIADCDSVCVLLSAMLQNIGLETQFVTIKADPRRRDEYSHVYLRVKIPGFGWIAADPIMPEKQFGWEAPMVFGKRYWPGSADEDDQPLDTTASVPMSGINGMSGMGDEPGFLDLLFGSEEQQPNYTDVLPGPVDPNYAAQQQALLYQNNCPSGYQLQPYQLQTYPPQTVRRCVPNVYNPLNPVTQFPAQPTYTQLPTAWPYQGVAPVASCDTYLNQRKAYQQAAALATRNYNSCKRGRPLAGLDGKPGRRAPRYIKPTVRRPKTMQGLGCGCAMAPVVAGLGVLKPLVSQTTIPGDQYIDQPDFAIENTQLSCNQIQLMIRGTINLLNRKRKEYSRLRTKIGSKADPIASDVRHLQNTLLDLKQRLAACKKSGMRGLGCGDTPCGPCAAKKAAGISGFNGLGAAEVDQSVMGFLGGQTKIDLMNAKAAIDRQGIELDALYNSIQKMTNLDQKKRALASYDVASRALGKSFSSFNAVRSKYNDAMTKVMAYAGAIPGVNVKTMLPGLAGGLGLVQIPAAAIGAIVGALALGYVVQQITSGIAVVKGDTNASRGYIDQTASLIREAGVAIPNIANAAIEYSWSALKIAAIGGIGYLLYSQRNTIIDVLKGRA